MCARVYTHSQTETCVTGGRDKIVKWQSEVNIQRFPTGSKINYRQRVIIKSISRLYVFQKSRKVKLTLQFKLMFRSELCASLYAFHLALLQQSIKMTNRLCLDCLDLYSLNRKQIGYYVYATSHQFCLLHFPKSLSK